MFKQRETAFVLLTTMQLQTIALTGCKQSYLVILTTWGRWDLHYVRERGWLDCVISLGEMRLRRERRIPNSKGSVTPNSQKEGGRGRKSAFKDM